MPDQFHPHLNVSSTREDLGIIKFYPAATSDNTAVTRPDLFPVLNTDNDTLQFSNDDFRHADDVAAPVELFGKRFATQPKIEIPRNPIMRLGFLAVINAGIKPPLGSR